MKLDYLTIFALLLFSSNMLTACGSTSDVADASPDGSTVGATTVDAGSDSGPQDAGVDAVVLVQDCDVERNTGCPDGTVCDYDDFMPGVELRTVCRSFDPSGRRGSECRASTDCDVGHGCRKSTPDSMGACVPFCVDDADCLAFGWRSCGPTVRGGFRICEEDCDLTDSSGCPDGWVCRFVSDAEPTQSGRVCLPECPGCRRGCTTSDDCDGTACTNERAEERHGSGLCSIDCDLLEGSGCGPEQTCRIGRSVASTCDLTGTVSEGEPCGGVNRCAAGLFCDRPPDEVCRRYCVVGADPSGCSGLCNSFPTPSVDNGIEYGKCVPE